ncbi:kazal-type serine peptidase inhibitor domain 3 [Osmerus mordax]|uniref:kazal-type serine peptidase inhibitor domain 3 n=1 Tax=Osmerus mordax TaxID=8014 RepID=UPI00350EF2E6
MATLNMSWGILICGILLNITLCASFPNKLDDFDTAIDTLDYDQIEDEYDDGNSTNCEDCIPEFCPESMGCRAGFVLDICGCCKECGNLEGQSCDLGDSNVFYGLCGEDLFCHVDDLNLGEGEVAEPLCACKTQDALCGSDGQTYMNICQFKEASFSNKNLKEKSKGPCKTVPIIKVPPQNLVNQTGSTMVFLCEVFAFPMALIEWRKEGEDVILPGDDPHVSVQSRGGPMKFELSSWLQIEGASPRDSGTYRCIARNGLGSVSATAVLGVLGPEDMSAYVRDSMAEMTDMMDYSPSRNYEEDYY